MSFSSRRRNYLLSPHRRDGLIEWYEQKLLHLFFVSGECRDLSFVVSTVFSYRLFF